MTLRHVLFARKFLPICACSISANSTIIGYFSHCLDRVATARERTSSIINIYNLITDFHTASCKKKTSKCIQHIAGYIILPANSSVRAATRCVKWARQRCSRSVVGDLTALLRRPYRVPTAGMSQRRARARILSWSKGTPWHGDRGDHMTANGVATEMLLCYGRSHCAHHGVLNFSWMPTVSATTQLWSYGHLSSQTYRDTNAYTYSIGVVG